MKCIAALFVYAAALALSAEAATVTVTLTGTVGNYSWDSSGSDNVFGLGTSLTGLPFTLVFTFNDANGTSSSSACYGGAMYESEASGSSTSNPPTIALTITNSGGSGGSTFTYGAGGNPGIDAGTWYTTRYASAICNSYNELVFSYWEDYSQGGGSSIGAGTIVAASSFASSDWRQVIGFPGISVSSGGLDFGIEVYNSAGTSLVAYAGGYLNPTSISVDGPACDIPISETSAFLSWADPYTTGYLLLPAYTATLNDINSSATTNFNGTSNVKEVVYSSGPDSCTGGSSTFTPGPPWDVGDATTNLYGPDYVGDSVSDIQYYSTHATLPCGYKAYQQMQWYCPADRNWYPYGGSNTGDPNEQAMTISSTQVSGHRGNANATPTTNPF